MTCHACPATAVRTLGTDKERAGRALATLNPALDGPDLEAHP